MVEPIKAGVLGRNYDKEDGANKWDHNWNAKNALAKVYRKGELVSAKMVSSYQAGRCIIDSSCNTKHFLPICSDCSRFR